MARTIVKHFIKTETGEFKKLIEWYGKSTETKPTEGIATGSTAVETNTWNAFMFDETDSSWNQAGGDD